MPSNTSAAVGTALQFSPQEQKIQIEKLSGVQQNYNVRPKQDYGMENAGKLMGALGIAFNNEDLEREKREYEVAKVIGTNIYNAASDKDKKTFTAAQLIQQSGNFKLIDNPYATAIIDNLRGRYVNNQILNEWQSLRNKQGLSSDLNQYMDEYQKYREQRMGEIMGDDPTPVTNKLAFQDGFNQTIIEDTANQTHQYLDQKDSDYKIKRVTGYQSEVDKFTRSLMYDTKYTKDNFLQDPKVMNILTALNGSQTPDTNQEIENLRYFAESLAVNTGRRDLVEALGEYQGFTGQLIKDIIPLSEFKDKANAYGEKMKTDQRLAMEDKLSKITSIPALDDTFKKMSPEDHREYAGSYDYHKRRIEAEQREREAAARAAAQKQSQSGNSTEFALGRARSIVANMASGNMTGVPQNDKDLIASGTNQESMAMAVREALDNAVANGNTAIFASIANQAIARKGMMDWFNTNLDIDIKSGNPDRPSVKAALAVMQGAGEYASIILDKHYSNMRMFDTVVKAYGPEEGANLYRQAMLAQADEGRVKQYRKEIEDLGDYGGNVASITFPQEDGVPEYLGDTNMPPVMAQKVKDLAVVLRSTGQFSASEAKARATQDIASQYVAFHNKDTGKLMCLIPKGDYQAIINGPQTNEDLDEAFTELRGDLKLVAYDEYQHKFTARDFGEAHAETFTLEELRNEALRLHNEHKNLDEEDTEEEED